MSGLDENPLKEEDRKKLEELGLPIPKPRVLKRVPLSVYKNGDYYIYELDTYEWDTSAVESRSITFPVSSYAGDPEHTSLVEFYTRIRNNNVDVVP